MRKIFSLILVALMLVGVLSACGNYCTCKSSLCYQKTAPFG
ncbi:hypothetical protein [Butyrivibrio sp.]|nr:hypothetical protein [Butyrivibrio sp.]